jgi:hypothetical protein
MMKRSSAALLMVVVAACSGAAGSPDTAQLPTASQAPIASQEPPSAEPITEAPATSPAPTSVASSAPTDTGRPGPPGESYADPEGAYRITVPDSWEARHGAIAEGIEVWLAGEVEDEFGPNVNVLTQASGNMTLDEYTETSIANAPTFVKDFEVLDSRRETGPNGTELAVLEYSGEAGSDRPLRFLAVWTVNDGRAVVATFTTTPERYDEQRGDVLPYLLTLEPQ